MADKKSIPKDNPDSALGREKFFKFTLLFYFSVFIIVLSNSKLAGEDDLFWHLATGRYIVQSGSIPSVDVFGFVTSGTEWIPFEWGWDIINYGLFSAGGFIMLNILSTILILLIFYLFFQNMQKLGTGYLASIFFLLLLAMGMILRLTVKPHLVTYLCFVLLITIITRYRYLKRDNYKILYLVPLIFLIWINFHLGVIAGFLLFGIYVVSEILGSYFKNSFLPEDIRPLNKKELFRLIAVLLASAAVTLVNPNGLNTYSYAFHTISLKQIDIIYEWVPPFSKLNLLDFNSIIYYIFILGLIPVLYYSVKKKDLLPSLLCIGFFLHSLQYVRFTVDFMIVSVLFLAVSISYILKEKVHLERFSFFKKKILRQIALSLLLLFLSCAVISNYFYSWLGYERKFGIGIDENNFPVKMFNFITEEKISETGERPFNTYETGGYLVWRLPSRKNFIDSRGLSDEIWDDYTSIINNQKGFEVRIDKINFDYFTWMVPFVNYAKNPALLNLGLLSYLFQNYATWKLIYWNDNSFLFVKNIPAFKKIITEFEYKYVSPFNFYFMRPLLEQGLADDKDRVLREIERKQKEDPSSLFLSAFLKQYAGKLNK